MKKLYTTLLTTLVVTAAASAETKTDTWYFGDMCDKANTYLTESNYSQYLPSGWSTKLANNYVLSFKTDTSSQNNICLSGPNGDASTASVLFIPVMAGTFGIEYYAYNYNNPAQIYVYSATKEGDTFTVGSEIFNKVYTSGGPTAYEWVECDVTDGYVALALGKGVRVNAVRNTYTPAAVTYSVSGKVTDSAGSALEGATVSAGAYSATSDATGVFTITELADGTYDFTAAKEGYVAQTKTVTVSGANVADVDFALEKEKPLPATLSGFVCDMSDYARLAGATVTLALSSDTETVLQEATTDAEGKYSFTVEGLEEPASYTIVATCPYYQGATYSRELSAGATLNLPILLNVKKLGLTVTIATADEQPVTGATLTLNGEGVDDLSVAETDTEGTYYLGNLKANLLKDNTYSLGITLPADYQPMEAQEVKFNDDNVTLNLTAEVMADTEISGTVTSQDGGAAIEGAYVKLTDTAGDTVADALTDAEGKYNLSISGALEAAYTLTVTREGFLSSAKTLESLERGKKYTEDVALAVDPAAGIFEIDATPGSETEVFDLSGRRIKQTRTLAPGIYIINGSKLFIK